MTAAKPISAFRLSSLLRLQKDPSAALKLFRNPNPEIVNPKKPFRYSLLCYDIIITKLGRAKMFEELQNVLHQLKIDTRIVPTEIIFCNVINFYGRARLPDRALQMFEEIPQYRCNRTVKSANSLMNALLKSGEFEKVKEVFVGMLKFGDPDACTYNILINGCIQSGCFDDAWKAFDEMLRKEVKPNGVTFGTLVYGLCKNSKLNEALNLKDDMLKVYGVRPTLHVCASLIKALCQVGELSLAFRLKEEMVEGGIRLDSAIYSTLISSLLKVGRNEEVSGILEEMRETGCKPDTVTYNILIQGFCKEGEFEAAHKILAEIETKECKPDIISYNTILGALCKEGKWTEATYLFEDMPRRGCAPDVLSYRILFDGLCDVMQFKEAAFILDEMIFKGYKPRHDSLLRFVQGLCENEEFELVGKVFSSLGKGKNIDADLWAVATSKICKKCDLSHISDSIDLSMQ